MWMRLKAYITFWKGKMEFISANKKRTAICLIWLLIYLSIVPMQLSNYVLCIGADGHVEFEIAADGRCTDPHGLSKKHAEVVIAAAASEEGHCGSCIDLAIFASLDLESYLVPVQNALIHPSTSVATLVAYRTNSSTLLTHTPLLGIPLMVDTTLVSLRTTTLLI